MPGRSPPVNIESGFFYFKRPRTQEDLETFWDRLCAYKEASFEVPLHPGHTLSVTNYIRSYHGHPSSGTRELPPLIRQWTGHTATMPLLVLQAPIQVGDCKWSQVWKGTMTSQDLPNLPPAPVIIKLFQESYLSYGLNIGDLWGDLEYAEWIPGARLAANEAWAYDRLRSLQGEFFTIQVTARVDAMTGFAGRTVPWSYGFCKVFIVPSSCATHKSSQCVLPNGEPTFGHIMEVIDGSTASTTTADELGLDEVGVFNLVQRFCLLHLLCTDGFTSEADALATAVHQMNECGVAHSDIKADNVIIHHNPSNQDCNPVLLDFSLCATLGSPSMQAHVALQDMARWDYF
jgi:serine/threonine protein kinase